MANPQIEDGHIRIATEIWENLCKTRIPGQAMQVFLAIIRKTYGWNKKEDFISYGQLSKMTGINRSKIVVLVGVLTRMNLIGVTQKGNTMNKYSINKNFETWRVLPKKVTGCSRIGEQGVPVKGNRSVPQKGNYNKQITTVQKTKYPENSKEFQLSLFCKDKILENYPNLEKSFNSNFIQKHCDCFEKLLRIDKKTEREIKSAIEYAIEDEFWKKQFQSPLKLRRTNRDGIKYIDVFLSKADCGNPFRQEEDISVTYKFNVCEHCGKNEGFYFTAKGDITSHVMCKSCKKEFKIKMF